MVAAGSPPPETSSATDDERSGKPFSAMVAPTAGPSSSAPPGPTGAPVSDAPGPTSASNASCAAFSPGGGTGHQYGSSTRPAWRRCSPPSTPTEASSSGRHASAYDAVPHAIRHARPASGPPSESANSSPTSAPVAKPGPAGANSNRPDALPSTEPRGRTGVSATGPTNLASPESTGGAGPPRRKTQRIHTHNPLLAQAGTVAGTMVLGAATFAADQAATRSSPAPVATASSADPVTT